MGKLQGKVAIVTGAGSGMGKEISLLFAKEGAKVVVSDMNPTSVEAVKKEIESSGGTAYSIVSDVSKEQDVSAMFDTALKQYGTLDILVNNAGIMDNFVPVDKVSDALWEKVFAVNTMGPMRTIRKAIPIFQEKKQGVIINIASVGGLYGSRAGVAYTASKHAVVGITKNVAFQYAGMNIRCNAIAPGAVKTNIGATITNPDSFGMERSMSGASINPRAGEANEIASIALFLASDDSSFVNGTVIVADAGWTSY